MVEKESRVVNGGRRGTSGVGKESRELRERRADAVLKISSNRDVEGRDDLWRPGEGNRMEKEWREESGRRKEQMELS